MAVSDVLSDAAADIRWWLKHEPERYADYSQRLKELLTTMDVIRVELDHPPSEHD